MIDRINLIMKAKNINASQFADEINIQRSGMSHILSGRNNPSLDFIKRVLSRYPEIDTDWLIFGKGEMYRTSAGNADMKKTEEIPLVPQSIENQTTMFDGDGQMDIFASETGNSEQENPILKSAEPQMVEKTAQSQSVENPIVENNAQLNEISINETLPTRSEHKTIVEKETKKAVRYLVFYSDHTFEEFTRAED